MSIELTDKDIIKIAEKLGDKELIRARLDTYYEQGKVKAEEFAQQAMKWYFKAELKDIFDKEIKKWLKEYHQEFVKEAQNIFKEASKK